MGLKALLLVPLFLPDLEQYDGKGASWRILVYPLAGVIVPALWWRGGQCSPYPYLADNLLVLPAITDVLWNTLDAYGRVWWWDDVNHLVNAMVFAGVIGLWAGRYPLGASVRFSLALGLGRTLLVLGRSASTWCSLRISPRWRLRTATRSAISRPVSQARSSEWVRALRHRHVRGGG